MRLMGNHNKNSHHKISLLSYVYLSQLFLEPLYTVKIKSFDYGSTLSTDNFVYTVALCLETMYIEHMYITRNRKGEIRNI